MSPLGDSDLVIQARSALLDALDALAIYRAAVVVIGAQAIYLHTSGSVLAMAESTKDSDLAVDPRRLSKEPVIEDVMRAAGFELDSTSRQPGAWISPDGIPVDLMVPEALAGAGGRRGARIPPHSKQATRRAVGLEAAVVDHKPMQVAALTAGDRRIHTVNVASPAALLVAKLHKLGDREGDPDRLADKDAHDIYRLLAVLPLERFVASLSDLRNDPLAGPATVQALAYLQSMFADGPDALGSLMAGRAEGLAGNPDVTSASVAILSQDILTELRL